MAVRRALQRAGVPDGFYACDPDLEGELVCALGPESMIHLVEERDHLAAFRTYQKQPDKRSPPLEAQLHGWLHNWKVRYAKALPPGHGPSSRLEARHRAPHPALGTGLRGA